MLVDIEEYLGHEIEVYDLSKTDYKTIIEDSDDGSNDWKKLIEEENERLGNKWD